MRNRRRYPLASEIAPGLRGDLLFGRATTKGSHPPDTPRSEKGPGSQRVTSTKRGQARSVSHRPCSTWSPAKPGLTFCSRHAFDLRAKSLITQRLILVESETYVVKKLMVDPIPT